MNRRVVAIPFESGLTFRPCNRCHAAFVRQESQSPLSRVSPSVLFREGALLSRSATSQSPLSRVSPSVNGQLQKEEADEIRRNPL